MLNIISGTLSTGAPPVATSYESIATVTVGSGGSSTISFTSISTDYTHLQLRWLGSTVNTNATLQNLFVKFNSDTGTTYSEHVLFGDGSSVSAGSAANASGSVGYIASNGSTIPSSFSAGVIDILDYANTNKYKTVRAIGGKDINATTDANNKNFIGLFSTSWRSTSAINQIDITSNSINFVQYSSFALYGIKGV